MYNNSNIPVKIKTTNTKLGLATHYFEIDDVYDLIDKYNLDVVHSNINDFYEGVENVGLSILSHQMLDLNDVCSFIYILNELMTTIKKLPANHSRRLVWGSLKFNRLNFNKKDKLIQLLKILDNLMTYFNIEPITLYFELVEPNTLFQRENEKYFDVDELKQSLVNIKVDNCIDMYTIDEKTIYKEMDVPIHVNEYNLEFALTTLKYLNIHPTEIILEYRQKPNIYRVEETLKRIRSFINEYK